MLACLVYASREKVFKLKNKTTLIRDKWCHLTLCLCLMQPNWKAAPLSKCQYLFSCFLCCSGYLSVSSTTSWGRQCLLASAAALKQPSNFCRTCYESSTRERSFPGRLSSRPKNGFQRGGRRPRRARPRISASGLQVRLVVRFSNSSSVANLLGPETELLGMC